MVATSLKLIGSAFFVLTAATASLAQNASNSGLNAVNPISSLVLPQAPPVPVSPAPPSGLVNSPQGINPFTGLPCTGAASATQLAPGFAFTDLPQVRVDLRVIATEAHDKAGVLFLDGSRRREAGRVGIPKLTNH
jgi:hypothetical protein